MNRNNQGISMAAVVIIVLVGLSIVLGTASYLLMKEDNKVSVIAPQEESLYQAEVSPKPEDEFQEELNTIQVESVDSDINELEVNASSL